MDIKDHFSLLCLSVFIGHKIPQDRRAFNTRDQIVAKAKALVDPPQLLFAYDHHNNCEAFANLLNGAADLETEDLQGVQGYYTHWCVAACCGLINCFRSCCRERENLRDAVKERLAERGLL